MIGVKMRRIGFALGQSPRSHPCRDRDRQFADVVRIGGPADMADVRGRKTHLLRRRGGQGRNRARMAEGKRHAHVDHVGDRQISLLGLILAEHPMGLGLER